MTEIFEPPVKSSSPYTTDGSKHARNWNALARFFESDFVGSAQITPGGVTTDGLADGAVTDAKVSDVSISKLTDGTLFALGTLVGGWQTAGGEIVYDGEGLVFIRDGATFFSLRPGEEPFIRGQVEALGLLVENDLVLRGTNNLIEAGAIVVMGGAATGATVGNPAAAPGLGVSRDSFELDDEPLEDTFRGLFYDATNTSWWSAQYVSVEFGGGALPGPGGGKPIPPAILEYDNNATHDAIRSFEINGALSIYGVVRLGTRVYVLFEHENGDVFLRAFAESDFAFLGGVNVSRELAGGVRGQPALGVVGSSLMVVDLNASGNLTFNEFLTGDTPTYSATIVSSGTGNPTLAITKRTVLTGFVVAESAWWVGIMDQTGTHHYRVEKFTQTTGVYVQNQSFENGQVIRGLAHDGTNFHTLGDQRVIKHSNWNWTTESARYHVAYTYVDDNSTVSVGSRPLGAGDFETKKSPTAAVTMPRRAKLTMSAAAVDTTLTGITHVGWYIERGASEPTLDYQADTAVTNGVQTTRTIDTFSTDGSPEAPPGSNTFPSAATNNFSRFASSDGTTLWRADGLIKMKVLQTNTQSLTDSVATVADWASVTFSPGGDPDGMVETANDRLQIPHAGMWAVFASATFQGNATGRRRLTVQHSVDGSVWTTLPGMQSNVDASPTGTSTCHMGDLHDLDLDDYLRLEVLQDSGGALDLQGWRLSVAAFGTSS